MPSKTMNAQEAAKKLAGCEYGDEGSAELWRDMKASGLIAIFGASDDLMEIRGASEDELGAFNGTTAYFTRSGLLKARCDDEDCPHEAERRDAADEVEACFDRDGYTWIYETTIPHRTFEVMENGEKYCRGIVFALEDVKP